MNQEMIRKIDQRNDGQRYFEQQQFQRQEQGWKLIIGTSVLLLALVAVELFWLVPTATSSSKSAFSGFVAVIGIISSVLWIVAQAVPFKVRWQSVSVALACLLGGGWALLFPLLIQQSHFFSVYAYSDLFIFLSVIAFFSYRPALYLAVLPILCSLLVTDMYFGGTNNAITFLSMGSRLIIIIVVRECLYHWFHASVWHEFEEKRLRKELASVALIDLVTGLQNDKHFELMLDREIMAARRHNSDLTVMMINIEPMHLYAMTCGHQACDDLLKRATKGLRRGVYRPRDFIARIGSSEFALLLPDTDASGAEIVAERMQRHVHRCCDMLVKGELEQPMAVMITIVEWAPNVNVRTMRRYMRDARSQLNLDEPQKCADSVSYYDPVKYR
ncbi:membrane-associated sensor domain-containing protein [Photobacterium frigidiphilum]|uniref:GGDEF domain-containing protein n=1 Tax=Photobacterium frigidiphilum TaxID=264736 RepID=UPI003D100850